MSSTPKLILAQRLNVQQVGDEKAKAEGELEKKLKANPDFGIQGQDAVTSRGNIQRMGKG